MTEYDAEFLEKLKKLCLEFDAKAGWWPDHPLHGFSIYYFALHPDTIINDYHIIDPEFKEGGDEYVEEWIKLQGEIRAQTSINQKTPVTRGKT
jgi:hypothetical protein